MTNPTAMDTYLDVLKEAFARCTRSAAVVPLLVDAVIVGVLGVCTAGLLAPPLLLGYTRMAMKVARDEPVAVGESFQGMQQFVGSFVLGLALLLVFLVGSVTVVGGFVALFLFSYAFNVMVDRPGIGAIDAMKASYAMVRAHATDALVLWGVLLVMGAVLAGTVLGNVVTLAFGAVLTAIMYRRAAT